MTLADWLTVIEIAATLAFAVSGLIVAAREKLDVVGAAVVAIAASFGGGTVRDVLLGRRPFFWVEHADWLWALMALSFAAMLLLRRRHLALTEKAIQWPDALGLGLFTANGALVALDAGMPAIVAVLMGDYLVGALVTPHQAPPSPGGPPAGAPAQGTAAAATADEGAGAAREPQDTGWAESDWEAVRTQLKDALVDMLVADQVAIAASSPLIVTAPPFWVAPNPWPLIVTACPTLRGVGASPVICARAVQSPLSTGAPVAPALLRAHMYTCFGPLHPAVNSRVTVRRTTS